MARRPPECYLTLMPHQVVVIETSDVISRRNPEKPCLYVGVHPVDEIEEEIPDTIPTWASHSEPRARPDLAPASIFNRRSNARERRSSLAKKLRRQGFTVNLCSQVWHLYVIELCPAEGSRDERPAVYVGQTSKSIEARFKQHIDGGLEHFAAGVVTRRGVRLLYEKIPDQTYYSEQDAKAAETRLGLRLEGEGYRVYGPQGMDPQED